MARASRMIVRSGRLISGLEGNARTRRVNGGRGALRPPSPVLFGVPQSLFVLPSPPVLLAIGALRHVRPAEPRARGHVQLSLAETAKSFGKEVQRRAVERERGSAVEGCAVDRWPQVHRGRPRVGSRRARRHPQVLAPDAARPPGGVGGQDLWVATRATTADPWSTPVNLGPTVNSTAFDGAPALSFDGTTLYFFSERLGGFGERELYVTTRARLGGPDVAKGADGKKYRRGAKHRKGLRHAG